MPTLSQMMESEEQRVAAAPESVDTGTVTTAPVSGVCSVNCGGQDESALVPIDITVYQYDLVAVLRTGGRLVVVGRLPGSFVAPAPAGPPDIGTVTTVPVGSQTITVNATGGPYTIPFLASYAPVVGDRVVLMWGSTGGFVLGKFGATATPAPPPPVVPPTPPAAPPPTQTPPPAKPKPKPKTGRATFTAQRAGSYRNGKWRTDSNVVAQYDWGGYGNNNGAWFYGTTPKAKLSGATVTGCAVRVQRRSGGVWAAQTLHLYRHTSNTRPGGDVSRVAGPTDASIAIGQALWVPLPTAWGQAIVDSGGGLGITGSPYIVLAGTDEDPQSGLLRIDWTKG